MISIRLVLFFGLLAICFVSNAERVKFNQKGCEVESSSMGLVVGGKTSQTSKWPWVVAFYTKSDEFFGGGSLISERFVLTAAQLLQDKGNKVPKEPKDLIAYLGKWNLTDKTEENAVTATPEAFYMHPEWDPSDTMWDADIALIKLNEDVVLSKTIQPVCLWTPEMVPVEENDGGIVVGWGATAGQEHGEHSDVLHEVRLKVKPFTDCSEDSMLKEVISPRGLCVGGDGVGPCFGDVGTGLFTARGGKWFLRGIVSMSLIDAVFQCKLDSPAVFTNVEKFSHWIKTTIDGSE